MGTARHFDTDRVAPQSSSRCVSLAEVLEYTTVDGERSEVVVSRGFDRLQKGLETLQVS